MKFLSPFLLFSFALAMGSCSARAEAATTPHPTSQKEPEVGPQPTWSELGALFGCDIKSPIVEGMAKQYRWDNYGHEGIGNFMSKDWSYRLVYKNSAIEVLFVCVNKADKGRPVYEKPLPFDLKPTDTKTQLYARFGPTNNCCGYTWDYSAYNIQFTFGDDNESIRTIIFRKRQTEK